MSRRGKKRRLIVAPPETPPQLEARSCVPWVAGVCLAFGAFVAIDQLVLRTAVLTTFEGHLPVSPLYAFWMPECRVAAVFFVVLALATSALLPRLLDHRTSDVWFGTALFALALSLPFALFLIREGSVMLGSQFLIYRGEEYFDDARRILDLPEFIRHYTEVAPQLSLHGRVHPPGFASLLFLIGQVAGPSPLAAGVAVLLIFAVGIVLAWRAFALVVGRRPARIATLLLLAVPSLLDFACTSMDAVFFTAACLVLFASFASVSARGRWWHAALAGVAFYLAMLCSFSAVPLGLFVLLYGIATWLPRRGPHIPLQLGLVLASFVVMYVLFRLATGFDLWESFEVARRQHYQIMGTVIGRSVSSVYVQTTFGNVSALLIGTGLAVVPLFGRSLIRAWRASESRALVVATTVTLAVLCAGGLYTMETERIFMFAMPWLALSAATVRLSNTAARLMLSIGWAQAFAMEALLFTLW